MFKYPKQKMRNNFYFNLIYQVNCYILAVIAAVFIIIVLIGGYSCSLRNITYIVDSQLTRIRLSGLRIIWYTSALKNWIKNEIPTINDGTTDSQRKNLRKFRLLWKCGRISSATMD